VGKSKIQFDIWGDTVNVAARIEQTSMPGRINISRATYEEIKDQFTCEPRGTLPIKNGSEVEMFFVA
jgi:class 3 adenylate cyclase